MMYSIESQGYWDRRFRNSDPKAYDFSESKPADSLARFCDAYLKYGAIVLDLACGSGRNAHCLAQRGYKVFGLDFARGAVDFCRKRFRLFNLSGTFLLGTMDELPFPDGIFASVICIAALDHVTPGCARQALAEIRRVLKPGSVMLLTFDHPEQDEDIIDDAEVMVDGTFRYVKGEYKGMLFRRYHDNDLKSFIGAARIISFDHTEEGARVIVCH